jgi:hypothetical protein
MQVGNPSGVNMQEARPDQERWDQLEAAVRDVVASTPEPPRGASRTPQSDRASRRPLVLVLMLVWSLIGWIWSTKPAFLFGAQRVVMESPAVEEATLRFALYLQRNRVDAFVRRNGQLPNALAAAGPTEAGVTLIRTSDGYELLGERGATRLRLGSRMSADSFLGGSLELLRPSTNPRP